jgi:hypothetical protein
MVDHELISSCVTVSYVLGEYSYYCGADMCRVPSCKMWCRVGLVSTDGSKERVASIFRVENMRERRKALAFG